MKADCFFAVILYVKKDAEVHEAAACQYEKMPNGMIVRDLLPYIEYGSDRIEDTSGKQQIESRRSQTFVKGLDCCKHEPSHDKVKEGRYDLKTIHEVTLEDDANDGKPTYNTE